MSQLRYVFSFVPGSNPQLLGGSMDTHLLYTQLLGGSMDTHLLYIQLLGGSMDTEDPTGDRDRSALISSNHYHVISNH